VFVAHEERVTPWKPIWWEDERLEAVRIWNRNTPFGMFQRHEWRSLDGSVWAEEWIPSAGCRWAHGAVAGDINLDDADRMAEALRTIRDGHNDPRALAAEILRDLGL